MAGNNGKVPEGQHAAAKFDVLALACAVCSTAARCRADRRDARYPYAFAVELAETAPAERIWAAIGRDCGVRMNVEADQRSRNKAVLLFVREEVKEATPPKRRGANRASCRPPGAAFARVRSPYFTDNLQTSS
jgi:hypothetical protein